MAPAVGLALAGATAGFWTGVVAESGLTGVWLEQAERKAAATTRIDTNRIEPHSFRVEK